MGPERFGVRRSFVAALSARERLEEDLMFVVLSEVQPHKELFDEYLAVATMLRPARSTAPQADSDPLTGRDRCAQPVEQRQLCG